MIDLETEINLPRAIRNLEGDLAGLKAALLDDATEAEITRIMNLGAGITRSAALDKIRRERAKTAA